MAATSPSSILLLNGRVSRKSYYRRCRFAGLVCILCIRGKQDRQHFTTDNDSAFMWSRNSKSCVVSRFSFLFNLASYPNRGGGGGSVERKKGRQRGIEGVASVVNEKITGSLPSGSCTKAVMTQLGLSQQTPAVNLGVNICKQIFISPREKYCES